MAKILDPITELRGMKSASGLTTDDLSSQSGIPRGRLEDSLRGSNRLTIDELTKLKFVLTQELTRRAVTSDPA